MTTPNERTRALLCARALLKELAAGVSDGSSREVALRAAGILRHLPEACDLEVSARALPLIWGAPERSSEP